MYLSHFGLNEPPFKITPHPDFFYDGANRGATLEALMYAIMHGEGMVKVTGEVGAGKTMLCRVLMEKLPDTVETIYLANPSLSKDEILYTIADELKLDMAGNRSTAVIRALQELLIDKYGEGRQVVVLIDEAHAMPLETLEEIRLLSNLESSHHKLLQMVLFGQPELNDNLALPHMRQLKERITHSFTLAPLALPEVREYLSFRMRAAGYRGPDVFSPAAIKALARAARGLTRRINILADKCLLAAFANNTHGIEVKHVKAAVRDSEFANRNPTLSPAMLGLVGGLLVVFALGAGWWLGRHSSENIKPPVAPPVATQVNPVESPLNHRLKTSLTLLNAEPNDRYTIQLLQTEANTTATQLFIDRASTLLGAANVYLYAHGTQQGKWSILYGIYTSQAAARDALNKLPTELKIYKPYARSMGNLRKE